MKKVYSLLLAVLALCVVAHAQSQLGEIRGKVIDSKTKKPLDFVSIQVELSGVVKAQVLTDDDGNYTIKTLQPGEYTVKASYVGYNNAVIQEVTVVSDNIAFVNVSMESSDGVTIKEVVIKRSRPLVDPEGKGGSVITSKEIMRLPQRNINMIANLTAGVNARAGATPTFRGARPEGTAYYIDGVRVQGSTNIPQAFIDQIQVITGGTPAQYGDFVGGAISINTKAPSKTWLRFFEVVTASPFYGWADNSHYNSMQGVISGPILMANKGRDNERVLIGFGVSASAAYSLDGSLPATDLYKVKDSKLREIEARPLVRTSTGGFVPAGEYLRKSDLQKVDQSQNVASYSLALSGNFNYQPTNNISLRFGYQAAFSRGKNFSYSNSLMNYDRNSMYQNFTIRPSVQFTQTFTKSDPEEAKKSSISGAFYTVRLSYERVFSESMDADFQRDFFRYGYIGKYTTYSMPFYQRVSKAFGTPGDKYYLQNTGDSVTLTNYIRQVGYVDTLYTFEPGPDNKIRGNYTSTIYDYYNSVEGRVSSLSQLRGLGGLVNGDEPIGVYSNMWASPGTLQAGYSKSMNETFALYVMSEASVAPKKNPKSKHDLQFGFTYEQQFRRGYSLGADGLWSLMRQLTNNQIAGPDSSKAYGKVDANGVFQDTVWFDDKIVSENQSNFDRQLRSRLQATGALDAYGNAITEKTRIDVNSYAPNTYSLDMFTADELLNNGNSLVSYYGYDYKGNRVSGKPDIDKFLNDPRNRTLGAYQPVYMAAWLQDKFVFKDLIVRLGVRVDRFDANQLVLKDPYSLAPMYSAGDVRRGDLAGLGSKIPGSIGDDYKVYVNSETQGSNLDIAGFRNGNDWYDRNGNPVTDPASIWRNANEAGASINRNIPFLVKEKQTVPDRSSFKDYVPDVKVSPRVWFSFPISTTSQFFGTYDVLVQRPTGANIGQIDDYFYLNNRLTSAIANPDLKMTQVTDYEIGFRQQLSDNSALGIIASYREYRNLIQLYRFVEAWPFPYTSYGNLDFATVKSVRLEYELRDLGNITLSANYTLQFAEGTGSNATSSAALVQVGLPTLRNIFPMDYDIRHTLKGSFDYHYKTGKEYDGPVIKGKKILEDAGFNLVFNYISGTPYTQTVIAVPEVQAGVVSRSQVKGTINGANLPPQFYVDLNVEKFFTFKNTALDGKVTNYRLRVFLWVQNVLNAANVLSVYQYTGSAYDDGYITSPQANEQKRVATNAQSFVDLYNTRVVNPNNFALPRLTRLGVSLFF